MERNWPPPGNVNMDELIRKSDKEKKKKNTRPMTIDFEGTQAKVSRFLSFCFDETEKSNVYVLLFSASQPPLPHRNCRANLIHSFCASVSRKKWCLSNNASDLDKGSYSLHVLWIHARVEENLHRGKKSARKSEEAKLNYSPLDALLYFST